MLVAEACYVLCHALASYVWGFDISDEPVSDATIEYETIGQS